MRKLFSVALTVLVAQLAHSATIPAGTYQVGDTAMDGGYRPRQVTVESYIIEDAQVIFSQWQQVRAWALTNGYLINSGASKKPNYPVYYVNWYDACKWCNARSEQQGMTPVYTVNGAVYRIGNAVPDANPNANGYRLPSADEWEIAARGGLTGQRFPNGMKISEAQANYYGQTYFPYDLGPSGYNTRTKYLPMPYIGNAGMFKPNGYGMYDMAGNVAQWTFTWSSSAYVFDPQSDQRNWWQRHFGKNRGSKALPTKKLYRGGTWADYAGNLRCGWPNAAVPTTMSNGIGFRCCRSHPDSQ